MTDARSRPSRGTGGVDAAILTLALALTVFTVVVLVAPRVAPATVNARLDLAILTASSLIAFAVAALNRARARVQGDVAALWRGAAFGILAVLNASTLAVLLLGSEEALGLSLEAPGQLPVIAAVIGRAAGAGLLVWAGLLALRGASRRVAPGVAWLPTIGFAALLAIGFAVRDGLPELIPAETLAAIAEMPTQPLARGSAPALVLAQAAIGVVFLWAATLAYRAHRRSRRIADALLSAGFLIAAFSQVHSAIHPGSFAPIVTTADLLRLAFFGVLLIGIVADSRDDLRALRHANVEVRRLADVEVATVAMEERARLAREIHDGLAQDLWYAKLKQSRLAQIAGFEGEAKRLSDEVGDALDAGLSEARHAVAAMRAGAESGPFLEVLERQVDDFADRFAMRADLDVDGTVPEIRPRRQAEILRIVQEALTNVRKHADATVVRVAVHTDGDLVIRVTDNGRGFRPEVEVGGFGLESMRQRAAVIGAQLSVASEPQDGTRVELRMPMTDEEEVG